MNLIKSFLLFILQLTLLVYAYEDEPDARKSVENLRSNLLGKIDENLKKKINFSVPFQYIGSINDGIYRGDVDPRKDIDIPPKSISNFHYELSKLIGIPAQGFYMEDLNYEIIIYSENISSDFRPKLLCLKINPSYPDKIELNLIKSATNLSYLPIKNNGIEALHKISHGMAVEIHPFELYQIDSLFETPIDRSDKNLKNALESLEKSIYIMENTNSIPLILRKIYIDNSTYKPMLDLFSSMGKLSRDNGITKIAVDEASTFLGKISGQNILSNGDVKYIIWMNNGNDFYLMNQKYYHNNELSFSLISYIDLLFRFSENEWNNENLNQLNKLSKLIKNLLQTK